MPTKIRTRKCNTSSDTMRTKTEADIVAEAKRMWRKSCEKFLAKEGDIGGCTLGAGIVRKGARLERGCRCCGPLPANDCDYLIQPSEVIRAQGELVWGSGVQKVVDFLNAHGVACYYLCGNAD
jgi:hypothetical protein